MVGELRRGGGLELRGFDEVLADRRAAAGEIVSERLVEEVIENADEDDEVGDRPTHRQDHVGDAVRRRVFGFGGMLLRRRRSDCGTRRIAVTEKSTDGGKGEFAL